MGELEDEVEALVDNRARMRVEIHDAHCQVGMLVWVCACVRACVYVLALSPQHLFLSVIRPRCSRVEYWLVNGGTRGGRNIRENSTTGRSGGEKRYWYNQNV